MYTLEEMIRNNPNWDAYPSIFSEFKTIPSASEDVKIIDDAFDAIIQNEPLQEVSHTHADAESQDNTMQTISQLINQRKDAGMSPGEALKQSLSPLSNFFDNEEDE